MCSWAVCYTAIDNGLRQTIMHVAEVVSSLIVTAFFCSQVCVARVGVEVGVGLI